MITALFQVEGVLAKPASTLPESTPIVEGMMLYRAMKTLGEIAMYSEHTEDKVSYWLQRERIEEPLWLRKFDGPNLGDVITQGRAAGHDLAYVITANPSHVVDAFRSGLQALLFVHPSYGRPEWRPDFDDTVRPWDQMVAEIVDKRLEVKQ